MPDYFVGRKVFRRWEGDGKVYRGTVMNTDKLKDSSGNVMDDNVWEIKWDNDADDNDVQDFDAEEMTRFGIDYEDGQIATNKAQDGASGSVVDENTPSSGDGNVGQLAGPGDVESENQPDDQTAKFYTTKQHETWLDVMDHLQIEDLDDQRTYYDYIKEHFSLGSNRQFEKVEGGQNFPSPIRKQEIKKERKKPWFKFPAGIRFPIPAGDHWDTYVNEKHCGIHDDHAENVEVAAYLTELEYLGVQCEVFMEFDVIKLMQSQDDNWDDLFEQVALADMSEELNEVVPQRTLEESKYYDEKGLPIAPKNFGELIKRKACQEGWYEAIDKEALGLEERGVFEYMTLPQAFAEGYASRDKPPVPMRLLLSVKVTPQGDLDKLKARAVIRGDRMMKGIHYAMVFAPTPSLCASKLVQGIAVERNMQRFAADVNQAFTIAENNKEEQITIRLPEGMRKYDKDGNELYGILRKNLYGSPAAPLNWAKCFNSYMNDELGKDDGWIVEQMDLEPCMFKIQIPDDVKTVRTADAAREVSESHEDDGDHQRIPRQDYDKFQQYRTMLLVVHVDDIDGAADDARDVSSLLQKLQDKFGITIVEPKYMLGLHRDSYTTDGTSVLELSQVSYIEDAWDEWKSHRGEKTAPKTPADGLKFTDADGRLMVPEADEAEEVLKMGYRKIVGTLLWPARNAYPAIQYAVVQLCRAMEKPSHRAFKSAMHCLHWLHEHRHEGIRFREDASPVPVCYYDSGHLQDRVDYKSFYGYVIVFKGAPIYWTSKKHAHVGESSAEDEYMALCHAAKQVVWLRYLLEDLGYGEWVREPTLLLGDNKQAGRWSRTNMITNGNRFIERMYHKVREFVEAGAIETRYINTKLNPADLFTKDVSREVVDTLVPMLTGRAPWPDIPEAEDALKEQLAWMMREAGMNRQAPLGGDEEPIDLTAESDGDDDDEHAGDYAGGDSDEIEYELVIGPITTLTGRLANWGTKVSLQLQPHKRGSFTVYQNVHAQIGKDSYEYSEAWSLNSTKSQQDLFSIPPGILRESTYECHADTWIEEGGIDPTYDKDGEPYDVKSPWGTVAGRWELRRPPEGAKVTTRTTRLHWRDGVLQAPFELRLTKRQPAAEQVWVPKPTWSPGTWVEKRVAVSRLGSSRRKIRRTTFGPDRALTTNVDGLD
jgi:hypothetical protein